MVIYGNTIHQNYAVRMLPLAEKLWEEHGNITTPFYANNLNLAGQAPKVVRAFVTARRYGSSLGYFAGAPKSWCVITAADEEVMKVIMLQHNIVIQYTRGTKYVGGYIGFNNMEKG